MSLIKPDNRQRFLRDERAYLDEWSMSGVQKQAIINRNYSALLALRGNVYYFSKLFFTDHKSIQYGSSQMAGMSEDDYVHMMAIGLPVTESPVRTRILADRQDHSDQSHSKIL